MEEKDLENTIQSYRELMTPQQCADYLGIPLGSVRKRVTAGSIPFEKISSHCVRFRKSTIDEWLKEDK